jgi:hypothetical protein
MENFPANSHKSKEPKKPATTEKKITKVTTGQVIVRKRSLGERFKHLFFSADFGSVAKYVAGEVILPAVKILAVDTIDQGARRAIYGDTGPSRRRSSDPMAPRISYNMPVDRSYGMRGPSMLPKQPPHYPPVRQRTQSVNEIILANRNDAEMVIQGLKDILDQYDSVSVADLYELIQAPAAHTDHMWGWTDLPYLGIRQIREGFIIDLPPAQPL